MWKDEFWGVGGLSGVEFSCLLRSRLVFGRAHGGRLMAGLVQANHMIKIMDGEGVFLLSKSWLDGHGERDKCFWEILGCMCWEPGILCLSYIWLGFCLMYMVINRWVFFIPD